MAKRKLLLADDSVTVQKVVNLAFESEDIEVITADDGMTALEKIAEFSPDLVMADINMPGADGYQICERIKQDASTKHIPVLLLVGSFEPFSEEKAQRVGAEGFLKKPFQSIGLLISRVTELLGMNEKADTDSSADGFNEADTQPMPAYESSETSESETAYSISDNWGETGMDDEMIETERGADYSFADETSKYETTTGFSVASEIDEAKTKPMTDAEIEELGLIGQNEETVEETVYELADEPDDYPSAASYVETETAEASKENSANQPDTYKDYSVYQKTEETVVFSEPAASRALELDDFQLLELPPLEPIADPFSTDYSTDKPTETYSKTDDSQTQSAREETAQTETDYSDYAETTAEDSYSMPQTAQSTETRESYYAPTQEPTADFDSSETQPEISEESSETPETETAKFAESYYSPESETETTEDYFGFEEEIEEISAADSEEDTAQNFTEEETETQTEFVSETQAMIAQETNQELSKVSDSKVVVHYLPPEVIDEIAERVVEKLAEKLRR